MAKDFDEVLANVGNDGPYQKRMVWLVIFPTSFFIAVMANLMLFQMAVPQHWCHIPGRENTALTVSEWKNITIPKIDEESSSCQQYLVGWEMQNLSLIPFVNHNKTRECTDGYEFDSSDFVSTWATAHDWYCEKREYSNNIFSASIAGSAVGSLLLPLISDKYTGRRLMFYISMVLTIVIFPLIWLPYFSVHIILRFLAGLAFISNYQMPYLIVLELISPDKRDFASCVSFIAWTMGMCSTSLVAWLIPMWDHLAFISCIPSVLCFIYWRYLPESPRWLLAHGRISECADVLTKIASVNGNTIPSRSELEMDLIFLRNQQDKDLSLTQTLRYPKLRTRIVLLHILFIACYTTYAITLLSINILESNIFLSHFVLSAFELPSNFLGWVLTHYLGRRFTLFSTVTLTGVFSATACFFLDDKWTLLVIVGFIKLFSTQYIYILIVIANEILPTPVRATGYAWMTVFGLIGEMFAPYSLTSDFGDSFPYLLIVSMMILSLIIGWPLPETIGLPLPQSFHDAEDQGNGRTITTWIHHWNFSKYNGSSATEHNREELKHMKI